MSQAVCDGKMLQDSKANAIAQIRVLGNKETRAEKWGNKIVAHDENDGE